MELKGFMIGPEMKTLFKIKVGAVIAEHPVAWQACATEQHYKLTTDSSDKNIENKMPDRMPSL